MKKKLLFLLIFIIVGFFSFTYFSKMENRKNFSWQDVFQQKSDRIDKEEKKNEEENSLKICDDFGRVFDSEKEAKALGLSPAQYGAKYCQYYHLDAIPAKEYQGMLNVGMDVDWAKTKKGIENYNEKVVKDFKKRGFSHVRIRVKDYNTKKILPQIKRVVSDSLRNRLIPVLAFQAGDFKENPNERELNRFVTWWREVSRELKDYAQDLSFDLIIESTDKLNKEPEVLNRAYEKAVAEIRKTNPERNIFISPVVRSAPENLHLLKIPSKGNGQILAEFHFYASGPDKNNPKKKWTKGTEKERDIIRNKIKTALAWQKQTGIPVWVGAWMAGNYNKGNDYSIPEQVKFARFVSEELHRVSIPFSINSDHVFYDYEKKDWIPSMEAILDVILLQEKSTIIQKQGEENKKDFVKKLLPLKSGKIYFSAFPDFGGSEDIVSKERVKEFENLIGRNIFWAPFSQNWGKSMAYPKKEIDAIYNAGVIPLVRFMPRSTFAENCSDQSFSLEKIIAGNFDAKLRAWAREAKKDGRMLLVDFAVEPNGNWFPWSGVCHGNNPKIYRDAYRHIITLFRNEGVRNLTWFFHPDINSMPDEEWNRAEQYYPGDEYIDWIGVSAYGPQNEAEDYWENLEDLFWNNEKNIKNLVHRKPFALMEFGVTDKNPRGDKAEWIHKAFQFIRSGKLPIRAINYWHENWEERDNVYALLRVDSSPESLKAFKEEARSPVFYPPLKKGEKTKTKTKKKNLCVYNNAYVENGKVDSIPTILEQARDCYVLLDPEGDISYERAIPTIKKKGNKVGCYTSIGTVERWRNDFDDFEPHRARRQWLEWDGEYFLKNVNDEVLSLMEKRLDYFARIGCDYVEFDNMDWADEEHISDYDLELSESEVKQYAHDLCVYAHQKGMRCMAKSTNFDDGIFDGLTLESYFDDKNWWAENEAKSMLWRGNPLVIVHYDERDCDSVYDFYKKKYGEKISFICEDKSKGEYRHYNLLK